MSRHPFPRTAMIFAAGLGTRMHPLTIDHPKALIPVSGRPLLDRVVDQLKAGGVEKIILNVHYHAHQILLHMRNRNDIECIISDETDRLLGQGGGLMKAMPFIEREPIIWIANVDSLWLTPHSETPLAQMSLVWDADAMDILLLLARPERSLGKSSAGDFFRTPQGNLVARSDLSVTDTTGTHLEPLYYTGLGLIKPNLFGPKSPYSHLCHPDPVFPLSPFLFEALQRNRLGHVIFEGFWLHIGTEEAKRAADHCPLLV